MEPKGVPWKPDLGLFAYCPPNDAERLSCKTFNAVGGKSSCTEVPHDFMSASVIDQPVNPQTNPCPTSRPTCTAVLHMLVNAVSGVRHAMCRALVSS